MPITRSFKVPDSARNLTLSNDNNAPLFLIFISSNDPATGAPWCPDVRAALPNIEAVFSSSDAPALGIVSVGQKPEWRELGNVYRTTWKVNNLPTLVRYERREGHVSEAGRLVEGELLDQSKLLKLVGATRTSSL